MGPEVHEQGALRQLLMTLFASVLLAHVSIASAQEERGITRVVYEFAVTSYCGTLDEAVTAGYHAEIEAVTRRSGIDAEAARRQRIQGWIDAEAEWRNRGLGGHRAWCADEGVAAAHHFQAIAHGRQQP
jgi:hypothetical protein